MSKGLLFWICELCAFNVKYGAHGGPKSEVSGKFKRVGAGYGKGPAEAAQRGNNQLRGLCRRSTVSGPAF